MDNKQIGLMNSLNALKCLLPHISNDPRDMVDYRRAVEGCIDVIERTLWDLYDRIEKLEKRLGDT